MGYLKRIDSLQDIDTAYCCEYLYENDRYYDKYKAMSTYFSINSRIKELNNKSEMLTDTFIHRSGESQHSVAKWLYYWFYVWIGASVVVSFLEAILDAAGVNPNHAGIRVARGPVSTLIKFFSLKT